MSIFANHERKRKQARYEAEMRRYKAQQRQDENLGRARNHQGRGLIEAMAQKSVSRTMKENLSKREAKRAADKRYAEQRSQAEKKPETRRWF